MGKANPPNAQQCTAACKIRGDSPVLLTPEISDTLFALGEHAKQYLREPEYGLVGHRVWPPSRMQVSMSKKIIKSVYVLGAMHPGLSIAYSLFTKS